MTHPETSAFEAWLADELQREEEECRRIAKRDGVPSEWIETVLAKLRGDKASRV